jgi:hypothetical protein
VSNEQDDNGSDYLTAQSQAFHPTKVEINVSNHRIMAKPTTSNSSTQVPMDGRDSKQEHCDQTGQPAEGTLVPMDDQSTKQDIRDQSGQLAKGEDSLKKQLFSQKAPGTSTEIEQEKTPVPSQQQSVTVTPPQTTLPSEDLFDDTPNVVLNASIGECHNLGEITRNFIQEIAERDNFISAIPPEDLFISSNAWLPQVFTEKGRDIMENYKTSEWTLKELLGVEQPKESDHVVLNENLVSARHLATPEEGSWGLMQFPDDDYGLDRVVFYLERFSNTNNLASVDDIKDVTFDFLTRTWSGADRAEMQEYRKTTAQTIERRFGLSTKKSSPKLTESLVAFKSGNANVNADHCLRMYRERYGLPFLILQGHHPLPPESRVLTGNMSYLVTASSMDKASPKVTGHEKPLILIRNRQNANHGYAGISTIDLLLPPPPSKQDHVRPNLFYPQKSFVDFSAANKTRRSGSHPYVPRHEHCFHLDSKVVERYGLVFYPHPGQLNPNEMASVMDPMQESWRASNILSLEKSVLLSYADPCHQHGPYSARERDLVEGAYQLLCLVGDHYSRYFENAAARMSPEDLIQPRTAGQLNQKLLILARLFCRRIIVFSLDPKTRAPGTIAFQVPGPGIGVSWPLLFIGTTGFVQLPSGQLGGRMFMPCCVAGVGRDDLPDTTQTSLSQNQANLPRFLSREVSYANLQEEQPPTDYTLLADLDGINIISLQITGIGDSFDTCDKIRDDNCSCRIALARRVQSRPVPPHSRLDIEVEAGEGWKRVNAFRFPTLEIGKILWNSLE